MIGLQSKWYDLETFPKHLMRDCKSQRKGMLMHNKLMLVREQELPSLSDHKQILWAYVGSANLSESAW